MVTKVYPRKNFLTGEVDCFYLERSGEYPERYEIYSGQWEGGPVPFVGY